MKLLRFLTFVFLGLTLLIIGALTVNFPSLAGIKFVQDLAMEMGGTVHDLLGGFGCIFGFLALTFGLLVYLRKKQLGFLFASIGSAAMICVIFFAAFGDVI